MSSSHHLSPTILAVRNQMIILVSFLSTIYSIFTFMKLCGARKSKTKFVHRPTGRWKHEEFRWGQDLSKFCHCGYIMNPLLVSSLTGYSFPAACDNSLLIIHVVYSFPCLHSLLLLIICWLAALLAYRIALFWCRLQTHYCIK